MRLSARHFSWGGRFMRDSESFGWTDKRAQRAKDSAGDSRAGASAARAPGQPRESWNIANQEVSSHMNRWKSMAGMAIKNRPMTDQKSVDADVITDAEESRQQPSKCANS